jgi:hypothetical protein
MIRTGQTILKFLFVFSALFCTLNSATNDDISGKVGIKGLNNILVPEIGILSPSFNWTYGQSYFALPAENQNISGTLSYGKDMAGTDVSIRIAGFNLTDYFKPNFDEADSRSYLRSSMARLNDSGQTHFGLAGVPGGLYNLYIFDDANKSRISILPLLVTQAELLTDSPGQIQAGDFLKIDMTSQASGAEKIYAALMLSRQDFENARLVMITNGTRESLNTTIRLGGNSTAISGMPRISSEFLLGLIALLPENSAIAMLNSTNSQVELNLITDSSWKNGDYILTTAAYSQGNLIGLNQSTIEVI